MLDDDPPELGLAEGKGLNHGHREEGESSTLAQPLNQPLALVSRAYIERRQESPAP